MEIVTVIVMGTAMEIGIGMDTVTQIGTGIVIAMAIVTVTGILIAAVK